MGLRILTVCTGNICRSPVAERLLAAAVADHAPPGEVLVGSAGTRPVVGAAIEPHAARLLTAAGGQASEFSARRLTPDLLRSADLVLGLTREHRSAAVQMSPAALRRAFTLRELSRLAGRIDREQLDAAAGPTASVAQRLRAVVDLAPLHRSPVVDPELDDVPDPYGLDADAFEVTHAQISRAVEEIMATVSPRRA